MFRQVSPPRLKVRTRRVALDADLVSYADPHDPLVWLRRGDGIVGVGAPLAVVPIGARDGDVDADPSRLWRRIAESAAVDDDVRVPGTGLVAFGSLPFAPDSPRGGVLVIPSTVVGRRGEDTWITRIEGLDEIVGPRGIPAPASPVAPLPYGEQWSATLGPGVLGREGYRDAVRAALAEIAAGTASKIVVARDVVGFLPSGADLRHLTRTLATDYRDTWTFAVDGLLGASPETLVTVSRGTVTARVLAGTLARGGDAQTDAAAAAALARSAKDLDEHRYATRSVVDALAPFTTALHAPEVPFTLQLPNVWHLATDVSGRLSAAATSLDLVAALHPTAAVAGTPTAAALAAIGRIEPFDRGRYAGPVGWIDASGDGEWAIALRCAQVDLAADDGARLPVVAHAGAGIVAGSDPDAELLETRVKFRPIVDALA